MKTPPKLCILALDLGTSAFKAAAVGSEGLIHEPIAFGISLLHDKDEVTSDAYVYWSAAISALSEAAEQAALAGYTVTAIGISSQAQTFVALDAEGLELTPAIAWLDARAVAEAAEVDRVLADAPERCGFLRTSPQQFLPKAIHLLRGNPDVRDRLWKLLLLNEYILYRLTGKPIGDTTNQGMGGFHHIGRDGWSAEALELAGITAEQLADVAPAAKRGASLSEEAARNLGIPPVPVFSCGNDQACAGAGAGLERAGDVLCNFGTAMVVYGGRRTWAAPESDNQIAGIDPLTGSFFLLGYESECGNVMEWLARTLRPCSSVGEMIRSATALDIAANDLPEVRVVPGGRIDLSRLTLSTQPLHIARAAIEYFSDRFGVLLRGVAGPEPKQLRLFASGGLSRSVAWLDFLSQRHGVAFKRVATEHAGLLGIARILSVHARRDQG